MCRGVFRAKRETLETLRRDGNAPHLGILLQPKDRALPEFAAFAPCSPSEGMKNRARATTPTHGKQTPCGLVCASTPLRDYLAVSFIHIEIKPFPHLKVVAALAPAWVSIMPKVVLMLGVFDDELVVAIKTPQLVVDSVCVQQVENICKVASSFLIFIHSL